MSVKYINNIVNGNEAVAWGALAAHVNYFTHYPGSPVNLVEPAIKKLAKKYNADITFNDPLNEHIAALAAAGASFCGARSLVVMKHVGMNIAADPFNYIGYTGVKGGMVIVVGTDPGANASTGEEDPHWYIPQLNFPTLEPTSIKEVYLYTKEAFDLSEKYELPVLIFMPVRLCYNSDILNIAEDNVQKITKRNFYFKKDRARYINVGEKNIRNHQLIIEKVNLMAQNEKKLKEYFNSKAKIGVITRGITLGHTYETIKTFGLGEKIHLLNLDLVYPIPKKYLLDFFNAKEEVVFIEDQDGFLENLVKMQLFNHLNCEIFGKDIFPQYGEIQLSQVQGFFITKFKLNSQKIEDKKLELEVPERLGTFCEGCPHRSSYFAINRALEGTDYIIGGDIGCSSLPPFLADWLMCMNAGIGISQGMAQVLNQQEVVSTGGEGSFFHAGLISLQSAVINEINLVHIVFDNQSVAMTGHQPSPTSTTSVDYKKLLKAIGVNYFYQVNANKPSEFSKILREAITKKGVKVIWAKGECVLIPSGFTSLKRSLISPKIINEKCQECTLCYDKLACPAIETVDESKSNFGIDLNRCTRCGSCHDICPKGAVTLNFKNSLLKLSAELVKYLTKSQ